MKEIWKDIKGYEGCYQQKNGKWLAQIVVNKKQIYLGTFDAEYKAKSAYREAAKKYLNIII
jgi:hypothetical protein